MKEKKDKVSLFSEKKDCCGCGACENVCPKKAISMKEDECGFIYPEIDYSLCVGCELCKKVCAFQNVEEKNSPIEVYAAIYRNREQAKKSASGGIFAAIAKKIIEDNGVVFGAAFDESWNVRHIEVTTLEELIKLQGSKYTQSLIDDTYKRAKEILQTGRKVLYSGTPCQIAGLKQYLNKEFDNLLTIDIVCHGVPNNKMFKEYINILENKNSGKLRCFNFRDKENGWGINGSAYIELENGKSIKRRIWQSASSYMYYFSKGWIYRENCYSCKYANSHRPGDITLGDYWGIEKEHPELLGKGGWNESEGISVVIANTEKGLSLLGLMNHYLELKPSSFEKASRRNTQLNKPTSPGKRVEVLCEYKKNGWDGIERLFAKNIGIRKYSSQIKWLIPSFIKKNIKRIKN